MSKIAAAGIKAPSVIPKATNNTNTVRKHAITSSPRDGAHVVTPSDVRMQPAQTAQPKKLVQTAAKPSQEPDTTGTSKPEVLIHAADSTTQHVKEDIAQEGLLAPAVPDENGTQLSSSSGSAKPPSLDGKSVGSGTTFALDEKESLRPDDSASVKAVDDEDVFSPSCPALPDSQIDSEEGVRAFRDQLREISSMDPKRRGMPPEGFRPSPLPPQGVLYVPPQGSGVGVVPPVSRGSTDVRTEEVDMPPDPKLLEALDSPRDRIWVLKLEQDIYDFVKDAKEAALDLPQCNAYHRMLAHKIADYYLLGHIVDDSGDGVRLYKTPNCRIPPPLTGITTPSTAASTPPPAAPQMKILRRGMDTNPAIANGSGIPSKSTSENGDSGNDDDKKRPPASREEREARYEAARLRIMGSAKPSEVPEVPTEADDSRSSSAAGKKPKKKQRSDSEDGFEARSAYGVFYPSAYGATSFSPASPQYGYQALNPANASAGAVAPGNFNARDQQSAHQYLPSQSPGPAWTGSASYGPGANSQAWTQGQQPGYDLPDEFQRALSFQPPSQPTNMAPSYQQSYNAQYYGAQQAWPPQSYPAPIQSHQPPYGHVQGYPSHPPSGMTQQQSQAYAYGQLPSQTFPGRPPSQLEHPLPGSYKSKHFNPQSQTFVPGQPSGNNGPPLAPHGPQSGAGFAGHYGMPSPMQRQTSSQSQNASYSSPHLAHNAITPSHAPSQPMMHPLPHPVFPCQASPSVLLPPKPGSTQQNADVQPNGPSPVMNGQNPSTIAKWVAPPSLPAKPPPPTEPFDHARFPQMQRQSSYSTAATARVPNGAMPTFGSMPPVTVTSPFQVGGVVKRGQ